MSTRLNLLILPDIYAVCRMPLKDSIPDWAMASSFYSVTQTSDEISIVCQSKDVPAGVKAKRSWRMLKVEGPLDFSSCGILASLAVPLADAEISIFAISTFDTDYILVQDKSISKAINVLKEVGHSVNH